MVCKKCGKEMPINKAKSYGGWKAYKKKCECGGEGKVSDKL